MGFTAWSSVREPSQVFQLLEIIYHSFDMIAKRRRVFKVETVGDCYGGWCLCLSNPRLIFGRILFSFLMKIR